MNCLILVALLLCCGNGSGFGLSGSCGGNCNNSGCRPGGSLNGNGCGSKEDDCGCGNGGRGRERQDNDSCGCRPDFGPEPRFEQRPFLFNQSADCGCEETQNNGCGCDR